MRRRGWDPSQKVAGPDEGQVDSMRLDLHRLVQEAACVDAVATYVDVAGFFFNVVKEDISSAKKLARSMRYTTAR